MYNLDINARIRQLLEERKYSVYQLSKESALSTSTLYGIYKNQNSPSLNTLLRICKCLNVTMGEFFLEYDFTNIIILTPTEQNHIMLYRSIPFRLQKHIDDYMLLFKKNNN